MRRTLARTLGGMAMGAAAWFSLGVLALAPERDASPLGLLPAWWLLIVFTALGGITAARLARVSIALFLLPALTILPWFGAAWPAALMWSGPTVVLLWALLATGVAVAYWPRDARVPARAGVAAIAAGVVMTAFAAGAWRSPVTGDAPHYLLIAQSLLTDGDFDLSNDYDPSRHQPFYAGPLVPHTVVAPSGKTYSFHGPGIAVVVLPAFAAFGLIGARVWLLTISALGAGALWEAVRRATGSSTAASAGTASMVLTLPFLSQSAAVFPDGAAAAITAFTLLTLIATERETPPDWRLAATGAALALLPWLHLRLALLAVVFGAALVFALWRRRAPLSSIAALAAAPIIGAALLFASSFVTFGTLDPTAAFRQVDTSGSLATTPVGAFGLLADIEYGLLPYAPASIVGLAALPHLIARQPVTGWATAAAVAGTWLAGGSFGWWGGTSSPARFLVPALPALALWFGVWWSAASARARTLVGGALVLSASIALLAAWADQGMYVMTAPDGRLTIFEWANRLVYLPDTLPSLFRAGRVLADEVLVGALWAGAGIVVASAAWRIARRPFLDTWAVSAWAIVAWLAAASTAVRAVRDTTAASIDRSQLALLQRSDDALLQTAWRGGRPARSADDVLRVIAFAAPAVEREVALHVPFPPAGRYTIEGAASAATLALVAGRDGALLWSWPAHAADQAPAFTTVMRVHSLRVLTSDAVSAEAVPVRLRSLGRAGLASDVSHLTAIQVIRQGRLLIYLVDAPQTLETGGFWLAGDRRTRLALADVEGAASPATLHLEAGELPVSVQLSRGNWRHTVSLAARERGAAAIPGAARVELMEIAVIGGERQRPAVFVSAEPSAGSR